MKYFLEKALEFSEKKLSHPELKLCLFHEMCRFIETCHSTESSEGKPLKKCFNNKEMLML